MDCSDSMASPSWTEGPPALLSGGRFSLKSEKLHNRRPLPSLSLSQHGKPSAFKATKRALAPFGTKRHTGSVIRSPPAPCHGSIKAPLTSEPSMIWRGSAEEGGGSAPNDELPRWTTSGSVRPKHRPISCLFPTVSSQKPRKRQMRATFGKSEALSEPLNSPVPLLRRVRSTSEDFSHPLPVPCRSQTPTGGCTNAAFCPLPLDETEEGEQAHPSECGCFVCRSKEVTNVAQELLGHVQRQLADIELDERKTSLKQHLRTNPDHLPDEDKIDSSSSDDELKKLYRDKPTMFREDEDYARGGSTSLERALALSEAQRAQKSGLPVEVRYSLPLAVATPKESHQTCTICQANYAVGCHIITLTCSHYFHARCVDEWLWTNDSCPLCRQAAAPQFSASSAPSMA